MKKFVAALTISILLASCQDFEAEQGVKYHNVKTYGVGATTCGEYIRLVEKDPLTEHLYVQWLHGYISGLNYLSRDAKDYAAGAKASDLMAWITNYCKQNPVDGFILAAHYLVEDIKTKPRSVDDGNL